MLMVRVAGSGTALFFVKGRAAIDRPRGGSASVSVI
jgi:hypothetical protein